MWLEFQQGAGLEARCMRQGNIPSLTVPLEGERAHHPHLADVETEALRGEVSSPRSHSI